MICTLFTVMALSVSADPQADPVATKMLADARAARAVWTNFPGFRADIEVNLNGQVSKGRFLVDASGKVTLEGLDKPAEEWARHVLRSVVDHRISNAADRNTPCAFIDKVAQHPQGQAIRVLEDELHSSYRIRDKQIVEVNRQMKDNRFTISVLDTPRNKEGKFLTGAFVVNYWDLKSGELLRSEANFQSWTRIGAFDLPTSALVMTASRKQGDAEGQSTKSLTLSKHQLLEAAARK